MPNKERLREWVKALRSGDYTQGELRNYRAGGWSTPDSYCCLGVACHVAEKAGVRFESNWRDALSMTEEARRWYGVSDGNPILEVEPLHHVSAANLNDNGTPFAVIADLIEKQFELREDSEPIDNG